MPRGFFKMSLNQKAIVDAIRQAKERSKKGNFTQSVELILNLKDIDMKSSEGRIQQRIELPHSSPEKPKKICVIATRGLALKAKNAKADLVIGKDRLGELAGKKKDMRRMANEYDFFLAEAPLMPLVGKTFGPALGPRGKMPVPVPPSGDVSGMIKRYRKTVSVRMRNQPVIQCRVGTGSMKEEEVAENVQAVLKALEGRLKKGIKNVKSVSLKMTMGSPVKVL